MNVKTMAIMAGLGGAMLLGTQSADAAYTGLSGTLVDGADAAITDGAFGQADTWRVYAEFSSMTDYLVGINGNALNPINITTSSGIFFQHSFDGGAQFNPINVALAGAFPELNRDSFISLARILSTDPAPVLLAQQVVGVTWGMSAVTSNNGSVLYAPNEPIAQAGGAGRVFIGQFTVEEGARLDVLTNILWTDGVAPAEVLDQSVNLTTAVPAPGALALLGLAGLAARRRRRA